MTALSRLAGEVLRQTLNSSFGSRNRIIEIGYRRGRHRAEYRLMSIRSYPREKK